MKLSGFLIVVKDIKKAEKYYHDLFGLEILVDKDGNMILSEADLLNVALFGFTAKALL